MDRAETSEFPDWTCHCWNATRSESNRLNASACAHTRTALIAVTSMSVVVESDDSWMNVLYPKIRNVPGDERV